MSGKRKAPGHYDSKGELWERESQKGPAKKQRAATNRTVTVDEYVYEEVLASGTVDPVREVGAPTRDEVERWETVEAYLTTCLVTGKWVDGVSFVRVLAADFLGKPNSPVNLLRSYPEDRLMHFIASLCVHGLHRDSELSLRELQAFVQRHVALDGAQLSIKSQER